LSGARAPVNIGVLASGSGSNFEALATAAQAGMLGNARIAVLIGNKAGIGAFDRAKRLGVESLLIASKGEERAAYFFRVSDELKRRGVGLVCLAGFLLKIEPVLLNAFSGRILNIHPSLLPKHGGPGKYGHFVHEAVLAVGDKESGCTVHLVDEIYDHGRVLAQARVPVLPGDTPESLAARVLAEEHKLYPAAVKNFIMTLKEPSTL
jgi:phosphoribosylglycinamide formyltransferase-1